MARVWRRHGEAARRWCLSTSAPCDAVLTLDDGQSARFKPGESQTIFAKKADFPQTLRVTDADGAPVFEQRIDYKALVDAEFRIAIGDDRIVFPVKPGAE